jgi:hypothetical protein
MKQVWLRSREGEFLNIFPISKLQGFWDNNPLVSIKINHVTPYYQPLWLANEHKYTETKI